MVDWRKNNLTNPKPARIPPQTPPAGGKRAEAGRIQNPRQIVSPCLVRISIFNHLDFARKIFELCPTNTAKIENRNRKPKWGRHEVLNVNADSVLRKHFWGRKPAKGLPAFGGAGGDQGRAGI